MTAIDLLTKTAHLDNLLNVSGIQEVVAFVPEDGNNVIQSWHSLSWKEVSFLFSAFIFSYTIQSVQTIELPE